MVSESKGTACSMMWIPIEKALTALIEVNIPKEEMEKGIPFVSFVVKGDEGSVFIKPLPLLMAEKSLKGCTEAQKEILYRVDYLFGGEGRFVAGSLKTWGRPATFLKLLEKNIKTGNVGADIMVLYNYLVIHLVLCRLERLAREEVSLWRKSEYGTESYKEADFFYYKEVLSYVEAGRKCLNTGNALPHFPKRDAFMARWYQEYGVSIT